MSERGSCWPGRRAELARLGLAALLALVALATRWPELDRYATIDESRWVSRAADFASYLRQRDLDRTFLVGHPGVTTMWLGSLGLGPERSRAFSYLEGQVDVTRREGYLAALVAARQAPVLANALVLGLLVWLAWGLFGPGPALLGGLLLVGDPFLAAHSRFIHLDALLASFMSLAGLAAIAFWRGGSWAYVALAGLATGLALLTKAPSIYLVPFVGGLALFEHLRRGGWRRRSGWLRLAGGLVGWLGLAWGVCLALWPALRLRPLVVLRQMVEFTARNGSGERDNFFLGRPVEDPGPLFYPLSFLFRATPLLVVGLLLLVAWLAWRQPRGERLWTVLLVGGYAVGFGLMMTLGQKKFDRYLLPAQPPLDLLAGVGLWVGARGLAGRYRAFGRWPARLGLSAGLAAVLAWPLASVWPYPLAYYNPLLGGGPAAQRAVFVGWGEGMDRVAEYLNAKPIVLQAPTVATAYHRVLQAHLSSNGALPLERVELADYIVPYVNSLQRDQKAGVLAPYLAGQEPEYVVWLDGIEYARVYRGPRYPIESRPAAQFGPHLRLESVVFAPGAGQARPGDELLLRLRWAAGGDRAGFLTGVRLVGPGERTILQERRPLAGALVEADRAVVDLQLTLPTSLPAGRYRLEATAEEAGRGALLTLPGGAAAFTFQTLEVLPAVAR